MCGVLCKMQWLGGNPSIFHLISILGLCYWTISIVFADTRLTPGSATDMEINIDKLINEIQERPAIWSMRSDEYTDRNRTKEFWEEIASIFVSDYASEQEKKDMGAFLQKKWKHKRDRYSRDESERNEKSGQDTCKKPLYMYAQLLPFLIGVMESPATDNSLDNIVLPEIPKDTVGQEYPTQEISNVLVGKKRKKGSLYKNKLIQTSENSMVQSQKKTTQDDDDDYHFLVSLLSSIKSIPLHLKLAARMEIMQCIHKYNAFQKTPVHQPPPTPQFSTAPVHHSLNVQPVYDIHSPPGVPPAHRHFPSETDANPSTFEIHLSSALISPIDSVYPYDD